MAGGDVRGTRDDWTTGPPKAQWPIATTLRKGIETRPGPLARKPTSRVSLCDTTRQSSPSTKRTNPRPPGSPAPIRHLRRADHHGGHGDAHLPPLPPFVYIFFSLWGPVGGGGLARTHGAFPRGANILSLLPKTPEGHMYSCASVGDASGWPFINRGLARAHDEALVHLSALCCTALHKSTPPPRTHRPDHTSRC